VVVEESGGIFNNTSSKIVVNFVALALILKFNMTGDLCNLKACIKYSGLWTRQSLSAAQRMAIKIN